MNTRTLGVYLCSFLLARMTPKVSPDLYPPFFHTPIKRERREKSGGGKENERERKKEKERERRGGRGDDAVSRVYFKLKTKIRRKV